MEIRSFELFGVNQKETNKPKKKRGGVAIREKETKEIIQCKDNCYLD